METFGVFAGVIALLAGVTHEVSEQMFGKLVNGVWMYWLSVLTGVGVLFSAQIASSYFPAELGILNNLPWQMTLVLGLITGISATKLHGVLSHDTGTSNASLSNVVAKAKDIVVNAVHRVTTVPEPVVIASPPVIVDFSTLPFGDRVLLGVEEVNAMLKDWRNHILSDTEAVARMDGIRKKYGDALPPFPAGYPL